MTSKQLQDVFLETLADKHIPVSIFLKNGIQLKGLVRGFDQHVIMLKGADLTQMIYRHAVSTILPSENIDVSSFASAE